MSSKREPVFDATIVARFRAEAQKRTKRISFKRRFLNRVADVMEGKRGPSRDIEVQKGLGLVLHKPTLQYWELVELICDNTPGIRGNQLEFGWYYGIRRSAGSK